MIDKIKTKLYKILSNKYENQIIDNAFSNEDKFPCIQIRLQKGDRKNRHKGFQSVIRYQIHIFSDYEGEKEILQMESEISNQLQDFYIIDGISYVEETSFRIIDDKSTGVMRKHGIIILAFYCEGDYQEEEENGQNNQTSP